MRNVKVCCWLYLTHLHIGAGSDQLGLELLVYLIWEAQPRHSFSLPLSLMLPLEEASTSMFNWYYVFMDLPNGTESIPLGR